MSPAAWHPGDAQERSLQARLGNQVSHPLVLSPAPLRYRLGVPVLLALSLLGAALFVAVMAAEGSASLPGIVAAGCFLALAAGLAAALWRRRTERCALTLYEKGVTVRRFGKTHLFPFEDIRELAVRERELLSNGVRLGLGRRVALRSSAARVAFSCLTLDPGPDQAGWFLDALRACLAEVLGARLRSGARLAGPGWELTRMGLRAGRGAPPLPVEALAAADLYGRRVALWRRGEEKPFFTVPAGSPNALVLLDLLAARLHGPASHPEGLGRALFEKRDRRFMVGLLAFAGAGLLTLFGVALSAGARVYAVAVLGAGFLAAALYKATRGFRCHERGVAAFSLFGRRQIRFDEVAEMSFQSVRQYHNGIYSGTSFELKLFPRDPGKPLTLKTESHGNEEDLERLRDDLAGLLAARLRERLGREREVAWTEGVWLSRGGVRFAARERNGPGQETFAPFSQDLRFSIEQGMFQLFVPGERQSVLGIPCNAEGFYPGLALFGRLASEWTVTSRPESAKIGAGG